MIHSCIFFFFSFFKLLYIIANLYMFCRKLSLGDKETLVPFLPEFT